MSELPKLMEANRAFSDGFNAGDLPMPPARPLAVLACMDARLHPERFLGLEIGDAHVVRNAGGRASEDALRSLLISSWLLGTREFVVIHHTDCGMLTFTDGVLQGSIREKTGVDVSDMEFLSFSDLDQSVRDDVERIRNAAKILPEDISVSGHVYDVKTGILREVVAPALVEP